MFDSLIEFIKNSVTAVVGLTVGALGLGGNISNVQTANISDTTLPVVEEVAVSEGAGEASALPIAVPIVSSPVVETEYFDRTDVAPAIFTRPTAEVVSVVSDETPVLVQDTSIVRSINPVKPIKKISETDVSLIIQTDFDKFDPQLKILKITEDENGFYSNYQFNSFAIKDNAWKAVVKEKNISVGKAFLGDQNLGDYLSKQLGEVVDNEIIFLKEVQEIQKAKLAKVAGEESQTTVSDYSALIGKVLEVTSNPPAPVQVVTESSQVVVPAVIQNNTTNSGVIDNEAPLVIIQGNNPALIQIGASYSDLGARVTDNISNNLGVVIGGDVVNTEVKGSYFVTYTATDEAGNVATATREVIVYDYGVAPEPEEENPVVEEVVTPVVEEVVEETPVVEEVVTPVVVVEEVITPIAEEEISTTTEEVAEPMVDEVTVAPSDVVTEIVESVAKGGKKASKKVTETVEVVGEATAAVVETVSETTTATTEQVSAGIETVAEEISAMIKAVHFMELIGNIRAALQASIGSVGKTLQASVATAGEGTSNFMGVIGSLAGTVSENIVEGVDWGVDGIYSVWQNSLLKLNTSFGGLVTITEGTLKKVVDNLDSFLQAYIGSYKKEELDPFEEVTFKKESFVSFAVKEIAKMPVKVIEKVADVALSLSASVKDYGQAVSSDLEIVGGQIDQELDKINLNPKGVVQIVSDSLSGTVSGVLNFFNNHRPF